MPKELKILPVRKLNKKNPTSQINDMMEALNGIVIYVSGIYDNDLFYPKII